MRLVNIDELQGEEIIAKAILDDCGRQLLVKGTRFRMAYIKKLKQMGVINIYIEDDISKDIEIRDVIAEVTRYEAQKLIKQQMMKYTPGGTVDVENIAGIVNKIVEDILSSSHMIYDLHDIKTNDSYTFQHSVNVCVLAALTASKAGMPQDVVQKIAMGSLLHDFGKIQVPKEILNKPTMLTDAEMGEMKNHALYGYEVFKDSPLVAPITKVTILMHHERVDGTGYPLQLTGDKIHEGAKICAICDAFDAMTSERVYKKGMATAECIRLMKASAGKQFDGELLDIFLENVAAYPLGTIVILTNGLVAIVIKNQKINLMKPVLRVIFNPKMPEKVQYEINLLEYPDLGIVSQVYWDQNEYKVLRT
jgi:HD-GYP domain-containing protein (c-di-GMP phosphodiesterase class II)